MAKKTEAERLADLDAKVKAIDAQRQAIIARQKERTKAIDTRRMILTGRAVWAEADKNPAAKQRLMALLGRYLSRSVDREVFDLAAKPTALADESQ
jgi:hypothetical protein